MAMRPSPGTCNALQGILLCLVTALAAPSASAEPGDLDGTFGAAGRLPLQILDADDNPRPLRIHAMAQQTDGKLVLVERNGDPGSALMLNDPWLRGTIYLDDNGQIDEAALRAAFPDREIVRYRAHWN